MFHDSNGNGSITSSEITQENHYYPFGMDMQGAWTATPTDNYKYNGKELDSDYGLNWYHYGARMYDPAIGRFTGVDPIADEFSHVSPYNYAENMPTIAVDLHGLQAFIVHGTLQEESGHSFSPQAVQELVRLSGNSKSNSSFRWRSPLTNNKKSRGKAAKELVQHISDTRSRMLSEGEIESHEHISLIGYSHGGNVAIQAAEMLYEEFGVQVNLVTISTPAYNGENDVENPEGNPGIFNHRQIVHENDNVVELAGGSETYNENINFVITEEQISLKGGIESHTDLPFHSGLSAFLNTIFTLPNAPAPVGLDEQDQEQNK